MKDVAAYIDHTVLKPVTTIGDIEKLCAEAAEFRFAAVCVPPGYVSRASKLLNGSGVAVATVIGFPFGYSVSGAKLAESTTAISEGASELDVVMNLGDLKNGDTGKMEREMKELLRLAHDAGIIVKVIIESGILSSEEITTCCHVYGGLGVDFMKTSTGYAEKGATPEAVQLMRRLLPSAIRIKASGGIRTYQDALQYIKLGADRIGCSAGVAIMQQQNALT